MCEGVRVWGQQLYLTWGNLSILLRFLLQLHCEGGGGERGGGRKGSQEGRKGRREGGRRKGRERGGRKMNSSTNHGSPLPPTPTHLV